MDLGLSGKGAVVAAASQGLGYAIARELAAEGASVVMCARGEERLRAAIQGVPAGGAIVLQVERAGELRYVAFEKE